MLELLALTIALVGSAIFGLYDLKTSDVPDLPAYAFILAGPIIFLVEGLLINNYTLLQASLTAGIAFATLGALLYYIGAWGAGDGAILSGIGFLVPLAPIASPTIAGVFILPFSLSFFISTFLVGITYSSLYMLAILIKNNKIDNVFGFSSQKQITVTFITIIGLTMLAKTLNTATPIYYLFSALIFLSVPLFYMSRETEKSFTRRVSKSKLSEGDILLDSSNLLRGLTLAEIRKIKKRSVLVRDGIRYIPVFFLALLAVLMFGDFYLALFLI